MKSILAMLFAITIVSLAGTSAMADTQPTSTEKTEQKNMTAEGERLVREAYTNLRDNRVDIPYNVVNIMYSIQQEHYANPYLDLAKSIVRDPMVIQGIQTYEGSDIITAPQVTKHAIKVITPKTHATAYATPETRTTTVTEGRYTITVENPSIELSIPHYTAVELVGRSSEGKTEISFTKPIALDIRGIDQGLKPFYQEPGTTVIKKIDQCNNGKLGKKQTMCYDAYTENRIQILTKQTGIFGLHQKVVDGEIVRKMPYRNSVFKSTLDLGFVTTGSVRDAATPQCSSQIEFTATSSYDETGNVIVNVPLTTEQKTTITKLVMILVDLNTGKVMASVPYSTSEDNNYVITRDDLGTITMQENQLGPARTLDNEIINNLVEKEFGVIVQAMSSAKTIPNDSIYQYKDNVYYVSTNPISDGIVSDVGAKLYHGVTFYQRGQVYKPIGETVSFGTPIKCEYGRTGVIFGTLTVSGNIVESTNDNTKYTITIDGPETKVYGKHGITKYVLANNGETVHKLTVSSADVTVDVAKSVLGVHEQLDVLAYSKNKLVGIGTLQHQ